MIPVEIALLPLSYLYFKGYCNNFNIGFLFLVFVRKDDQWVGRHMAWHMTIQHSIIQYEYILVRYAA